MDRYFFRIVVAILDGMKRCKPFIVFKALEDLQSLGFV